MNLCKGRDFFGIFFCFATLSNSDILHTTTSVGKVAKDISLCNHRLCVQVVLL